MSLILEALKKSEAERQRQSGPTLLEVRIAKPQRRYPIWALVVGLLLAVNMILLLVFMLRRPGAPNQDTAMAPPPASIPPIQPAMPAAPAKPLNARAAPAPPSAGAADNAPTLSDDAAGDAQNPADEQPAIPKPSGSVKIQRDDSAGYSSLPSFNEVGANMPDLRLDLHVYAQQARDRYALINMQTVHEGDTLSEGARVLAITREGVALDFRGQQFMLRPQ